MERGRTISWLLRAACAALALLAITRLWPMIEGAANGDIRYGEDFLTAVYGPNELVAEGTNPWSVEAAVPRYGSYPATPIIPSSYLAFPALDAIGREATVTGWMVLTILITVVGIRSITRSLGCGPEAAWLISLLVLNSPPSLYNVEQGQTGAGLIAAAAFFAVRARPTPRWWDHAEAGLHLATICYLFAKPTFALGFLAAEFAYRRRVRLFAIIAPTIVVLGGISMLVISARTDLSIGTLVDSARAAGELLGEAPVNRMDGDRLDLLSLFWPSPVLDVFMLLVAAALVVVINRLPGTTLHERLLLGTTAATLLTYHHIYDSLPLLGMVAATAALWGVRRGVVLAVALVVVGWIDDVNRISTTWQDVIGIDWFVLRSRLVFFLCLGVAAVVLVDRRRRLASDDGTATGAPAIA